MADVKGTMFFTQFNPNGQAAGWSESFILTTAATLPLALADLDALAQKRIKMCGSGVSMNYLRVSRLGLRGDSQVRVPTITEGRVQDDVADIAGAGVLTRIEGSDDLFLARRSYFIKGNPDVAEVITAPITSNDQWNTAYQAFRDVLINGKYGFMVIDRSGANPDKPITAVTNAVPAVITCPGHGFTAPQLVRVTGVRFAPPAGSSTQIRISGIFQVATTPSGDTLTLLGFAPTTAYVGGGTIKRYDKVQKVITSIEIRRYGVHRVGRPFDTARGRFARRVP